MAQVMEEGERLSIKQSNMESTIKKLRSQIKELEASHTQTTAKLAVEEGKLEAATKARQKAEAAAAAAQQQHKADLEQQKQHFEVLLKQAQNSQVTGGIMVHGTAFPASKLSPVPCFLAPLPSFHRFSFVLRLSAESHFQMVGAFSCTVSTAPPLFLCTSPAWLYLT